MNNIFSEKAWEDYTDWQLKDKLIVRKINELIKDINCNSLYRKQQVFHTGYYQCTFEV